MQRDRLGACSLACILHAFSLSFTNHFSFFSFSFRLTLLIYYEKTYLQVKLNERENEMFFDIRYQRAYNAVNAAHLCGKISLQDCEWATYLILRADSNAMERFYRESDY